MTGIASELRSTTFPAIQTSVITLALPPPDIWDDIFVSLWVKLTANFRPQRSEFKRPEGRDSAGVIFLPDSERFPPVGHKLWFKKKRSRDQDTEQESKTPLVLNSSASTAAVDLSQAWYNMLTRSSACSGTLRQETPVWLLVYPTGLDAQFRCDDYIWFYLPLKVTYIWHLHLQLK